MDAKIRKQCFYRRSNDEQSNPRASLADEFDEKYLLFLDDNFVLDSYTLELAKRGRWFAVGYDDPSVAGVDVNKPPINRVSHQMTDEAFELCPRHRSENSTAQNYLNLPPSNPSGSDSEFALANFESPLERKYGSSVEEILSRKIKVNFSATDEEKKTLLHHAAEQDNVDAVRMLLAMAREDGTDARFHAYIDLQDMHGRTALILAVIGFKSIAMVSKQSEVSKNSQSSTTVNDSRLSVIEELLAADANVNLVDKLNSNALHHAAEQGSVDAVRMLLTIESDGVSYTIDVNAPGDEERTALMLAAMNGHEEVVRALIETEVRSRVAVRERNLMKLIAEKTCQWSYKKPVLHINARDPRGWTALMYAENRGNANIFKLLLESGADVLTCDNDGNNALHLSIMPDENGLSQDRQLIIETLIDCGLNINSQNFAGDGVLQYTVRRYRHFSRIFEILEFLIKRTGNAALNTTNASGQTLIHAMLSNMKSKLNCERLEQFLSSHDVDLQVRDIEQKTALDYITCVECRQLAIRTIPALNAHGDNHSSAQCASYKTHLFENLLRKSSSPGSVLMMFPGNILEYWYRYILARKRYNHFSECSPDEEKFDSFTKYLTVRALNAHPDARDKRGRTYLHLITLLTFCDSDRIRQKCYKIYRNIEAVGHEVKKNINIVDGRGRTVLHYVANRMQYSSFINLSQEEAKFFMKIIELGDVTARDCYGRTPLHYAAMSLECAGRLDVYAMRANADDLETLDIYKLLVKRGADVKAIDMFQKTPQQLRALFINFTQFALYNEKLLRSSEAKMLSNWKKLLPTHYCLPTCRNVNFSSIRVDNVLSTNEEYLNEYQKGYTIFRSLHTEMFRNLSSAYRDKVNIIFWKEVRALICSLVAAVQAVDPRLKGHVVEVGSAYEKTKAGFPDEFDFDVVLTEFSNVYQVSSSPVCPAGYVLLKRSRTSQNDDCLNEFFSNDKFLLITKVRSKYERTFKKVVRKSEFWRNNILVELNMADDSDLYLYDSARVCITLRLVVNAPINGNYVFHPIWVDIFPCIQCGPIWPDTARSPCRNLKLGGCHLVFHQPQKIYPWIPVSIPYARVSFARVESSVIRSCSAVVKAAFVIAKFFFQSNLYRYAHWERPIQKVTSHVLKTAVLHCMASAARDKTKRYSRWSTDYDSVTETELKRFNRELLYCLLQFHQRGCAPSFFLHGLIVSTWNDKKILKENDLHKEYFHASLKGMPPWYIEKCMTKNLQRKSSGSKGVGLDVSDYIKLTHAVYWWCCEEGDSARLFNPYYASNPLVEYFYLWNTAEQGRNDQSKSSALHRAAEQDNADAMRMPLAIERDEISHAADVNARDDSERTALMLILKHEEVVPTLIATGVRSGVAVRERDCMEPSTGPAASLSKVTVKLYSGGICDNGQEHVMTKVNQFYRSKLTELGRWLAKQTWAIHYSVGKNAYMISHTNNVTKDDVIQMLKNNRFWDVPYLRIRLVKSLIGSFRHTYTTPVYQTHENKSVEQMFEKLSVMETAQAELVVKVDELKGEWSTLTESKWTLVTPKNTRKLGGVMDGGRVSITSMTKDQEEGPKERQGISGGTKPSEVEEKVPEPEELKSRRKAGTRRSKGASAKLTRRAGVKNSVWSRMAIKTKPKRTVSKTGQKLQEVEGRKEVAGTENKGRTRQEVGVKTNGESWN